MGSKRLHAGRILQMDRTGRGYSVAAMPRWDDSQLRSVLQWLDRWPLDSATSRCQGSKTQVPDNRGFIQEALGRIQPLADRLSKNCPHHGHPHAHLLFSVAWSMWRLCFPTVAS